MFPQWLNSADIPLYCTNKHMHPIEELGSIHKRRIR